MVVRTESLFRCYQDARSILEIVFESSISAEVSDCPNLEGSAPIHVTYWLGLSLAVREEKKWLESNDPPVDLNPFNVAWDDPNYLNSEDAKRWASFDSLAKWKRLLDSAEWQGLLPPWKSNSFYKDCKTKTPPEEREAQMFLENVFADTALPMEMDDQSQQPEGMGEGGENASSRKCQSAEQRGRQGGETQQVGLKPAHPAGSWEKGVGGRGGGSGGEGRTNVPGRCLGQRFRTNGDG